MHAQRLVSRQKWIAGNSVNKSRTRDPEYRGVCTTEQIMQHDQQLLALLIKGARNREVQRRTKQSIGNVTDYSKRLMYERCAEQTFPRLRAELRLSTHGKT